MEEKPKQKVFKVRNPGKPLFVKPKKEESSKYQPISIGYMTSAIPMKGLFNPRIGYLKIKYNYRLQGIEKYDGEKIFILKKQGNYFKGDGFTIGLLGEGMEDGHGHNIVPYLKSKGEKYYGHYSSMCKIDPYIRTFLRPL